MSKGLYSRPSYVPYERVDFVKSQNLLTGWFGERRPLNAIEINNIYFNLNKSIMARALAIGFSQVAKTKEVIDFLTNAIAVAKKHIEIFSSVLEDDDLTTPIHWDTDVTTSITSPFSDKLLMHQAGFLFQTSLGYYGAGLATSMRADLITHYSRTIAENLKEAEDWANIMIKHGWLEQAPQAPDRKELAKEKMMEWFIQIQ
ncbi:DUF3231 family protein [Ammoniphilus sp. 3BR4]|uniref:DUF3231 family protein n=1 Tax=Ammoniphilus sp. 3BR4 TaxID=3158265 RepID=UPI003466A406